MAHILEIQDLHKSYRNVHALRGVNLLLPGPGIYGFLGPNGAGKTTTIKLIAGLIQPTSGVIRVNGIDITADPVGALRRMGVMMETPHFYGHLSGRANLQVLARLSGTLDQSRIERLLDHVGLPVKANDRVSSYSRGMRQRLGLAAALLDDPALVILDEPMNGLDPEGIVAMRQWFSEMARAENRAILLSSHQMGEMERVCDNFTIINQGQIVASGNATELAGPRTTTVIRVRDTEVASRALHEMSGITGVEIIGADRIRADAPNLSAAQINKFLVNQHIDVLEITEEKETLEEIFFRLVGRNHDVA